MGRAGVADDEEQVHQAMLRIRPDNAMVLMSKAGPHISDALQHSSQEAAGLQTNGLIQQVQRTRYSRPSFCTVWSSEGST